jgi:hypothetical protein
MNIHNTPELSDNLSKRIRLVRRDMGSLLFHFTRRPPESWVNVLLDDHRSLGIIGSAYSILRKILHEGKLRGSSKWSYGHSCICFTEAPIQEFNSIFSLAEIASSNDERPRYEPYGIAVSKTWLFEQGGRPVIYDHPDSFDNFSANQQYRFVPYEPEKGIDFTWEREWRINAEALTLDPKHTFVIVPTSEEAFELVYGFANEEADWDVEGSSGEGFITGVYHAPKWLAVSLDLFGFKHSGVEPTELPVDALLGL